MNKPLPIGLLGLLLVAPLATAQTCNPNMPAATPSERFTVHGDGTLTDSQTGLMWKQCAQGQTGSDCAGTPTTHTWQQALEQADAASDAGYSDWRLPNIKELPSIVETKCYSPSINLAVFPNTPSSWFWSSSAYAYNSDYAWFVAFNYGGDSNSYRNGHGAVRLVRGGQ